jgi:uncharacterized protein (UPF0276 family)
MSSNSRFSNIAALGVGITYSSELHELIVSNPTLFPVVEIEPQTLFMETRKGAAPFRVLDEVFERLHALPGKKLIHSVGAPIGGTVAPDADQIALLKNVVDLFKPPYLSEHLSFNKVHGFQTGFFLPPRQTPAGVQKAVAGIKKLQDALQLPLAVETGVNYLRLRPDEMEDGEFVAAVAEQADCGILLDLHNLFTNQQNGRQSIGHFLQQIPKDRVLEVHLAGGFEMDGYYLDSHSGPIPELLLEISGSVIRQLTNLKAIIFEIFPAYLSLTGLDLIKDEVGKIHQLWNIRGSQPTPSNSIPYSDKKAVVQWEKALSPEQWEQTVGGLTVGQQPHLEDLFGNLKEDPGIEIIQKLVKEFRASMLVNVMPLTCRMMMLTVKVEGFLTVLNDYWSKHTPQLYASSEALQFAAYLEKINLRVPALNRILAYERAVVETLLDDETRVVKFHVDPIPLLSALADGKLPDEDPEPGDFEVEITADLYETLSATGQYMTPATAKFH